MCSCTVACMTWPVLQSTLLSCLFCRALAEEDSREVSAGAIAKAAGSAGATLYQQGTFARSGLKLLEAYLTRKAGMYPDVAEQLVTNHLQKDDLMSALITGEW